MRSRRTGHIIKAGCPSTKPTSKKTRIASSAMSARACTSRLRYRRSMGSVFSPLQPPTKIHKSATNKIYIRTIRGSMPTLILAITILFKRNLAAIRCTIVRTTGGATETVVKIVREDGWTRCRVAISTTNTSANKMMSAS